LYPWQQRNSSARRCQLLFFGGGSGGGGGDGPGGGPLYKSYLEVHFRIGDAKAVYSLGTPLSSYFERGSEDGWPPGRHHNNLLINGWAHESRWSLRSDWSWYQHLNNFSGSPGSITVVHARVLSHSSQQLQRLASGGGPPPGSG